MMPSPDHAATVRLTTRDVIEHDYVDEGWEDREWVPAAALDALVAAVAQAEHERDEARRECATFKRALASIEKDTLLMKERAERQRDQAIEALRWLRSLDDPGNQERRTVTLTQIINRARDVLVNIEKENNVH